MASRLGIDVGGHVHRSPALRRRDRPALAVQDPLDPRRPVDRHPDRGARHPRPGRRVGRQRFEPAPRHDRVHQHRARGEGGEGGPPRHPGLRADPASRPVPDPGAARGLDDHAKARSARGPRAHPGGAGADERAGRGGDRARRGARPRRDRGAGRGGGGVDHDLAPPRLREPRPRTAARGARARAGPRAAGHHRLRDPRRVPGVRTDPRRGHERLRGAEHAPLSRPLRGKASGGRVRSARAHRALRRGPDERFPRLRVPGPHHALGAGRRGVGSGLPRLPRGPYGGPRIRHGGHLHRRVPHPGGEAQHLAPDLARLLPDQGALGGGAQCRGGRGLDRARADDGGAQGRARERGGPARPGPATAGAATGRR